MISIIERLKRMDWRDWLTAPIWVPLRAVVALVFWGKRFAYFPLYMLLGATVADWWEDTVVQFHVVYDTPSAPERE